MPGVPAVTGYVERMQAPLTGRVLKGTPERRPCPVTTAEAQLTAHLEELER